MEFLLDCLSNAVSLQEGTHESFVGRDLLPSKRQQSRFLAAALRPETKAPVLTAFLVTTCWGEADRGYGQT